jgi:signal transduction histidine kinase
MNAAGSLIHMISSDPDVAQKCIEELAAFGARYRTPVSSTVEQARNALRRSTPAVLFLDESAIQSTMQDRNAPGSLESAVARLTEIAPVVVAAAPEKQEELRFLITSGAVDFVARTNHFLPIVAGMLDRRARMAARVIGTVQFPGDGLSGDFGEILRHEVNNPLTGILGNTELLLARRDRLPLAAVERLETIAELAVRLRETVRRLSNACDERHEPVRPA